MEQEALVTAHFEAFDHHHDLHFELTYTENILDIVFAKLNRGSGQEDLELLEQRRSLSTGDAVTIQVGDHITKWRCMPVGWTQILEEEL